ncbi:hypothetical protein HK100_008069 [Physocladia obscura]|uniref:Uncharacterized protein n=1 Tax=Physocladia obscura TaxID=109957 RepID=A0AAD5T5C9_9FUNG|nr:hypothetical protein HK100_008069 [Physocladia obscura]
MVMHEIKRNIEKDQPNRQSNELKKKKSVELRSAEGSYVIRSVGFVKPKEKEKSEEVTTAIVMTIAIAITRPDVFALSNVSIASKPSILPLCRIPLRTIFGHTAPAKLRLASLKKVTVLQLPLLSLQQRRDSNEQIPIGTSIVLILCILSILFALLYLGVTQCRKHAIISRALAASAERNGGAVEGNGIAGARIFGGWERILNWNQQRQAAILPRTPSPPQERSLWNKLGWLDEAVQQRRLLKKAQDRGFENLDDQNNSSGGRVSRVFLQDESRVNSSRRLTDLRISGKIARLDHVAAGAIHSDFIEGDDDEEDGDDSIGFENEAEEYEDGGDIGLVRNSRVTSWQNEHGMAILRVDE